MKNNQDQFLNKVASKTNVNKDDILNLANAFQTKDLSSESNLRELIQQVSRLSGRDVSKSKEDQIINMVKNDKIPKDFMNN
ncbi:stage VI sporulation protein F [Beduini massiliensis]|uniref:stage VI sporulation protein F n=1 Tax=Beduini massiliensis TaxID=1585974 RepID=UPI00059A7EB0|nr:stage VI sporulation protein F [Beduini massiliensis]